MIRLTAAELASVVAGRLVAGHQAAGHQAVGNLSGAGDVSFHGVVQDSRRARPEALFVALRGERFDGHTFVTPELAAAVLLVERELAHPSPQVVVSDTLAALTQLARFWRRRCPARVAALTGSNGKTSTKEMIRAIVSEAGSVHATEGNLNNHIGVPLTLLALPETADFAVIEMGANHAGEIAALTACAQPDVALITNAGRAHLEGFGSVEGVSRAKGEIYQGLPEGGGVAVINFDDTYADYWLSLNVGRRCLGFSLLRRPAANTTGRPAANATARSAASDTGQPTASVTEQPGVSRPGGSLIEQPAARVTEEPAVSGTWHPPRHLEIRIGAESAALELAVPGKHLAQNALAAATVALALDCDLGQIVAGLSRWRPVAGRLRAYRHASGARVWDDTYNANPDSIRAALEVLSGEPGQRILVLGDMLELGAEATDLHAQVGIWAHDLGIQRLYATGPLSQAAVAAFGAQAAWFASHEPLIQALVPELAADTVVLAKGSRGQRMETVLNALNLSPETEPEVADAARAR